MNSVIPFTNLTKFYVFTDEQEVNLVFKLNDFAVFKTCFTFDEFDYISDNWNKDNGVQRYDTEHNGRIWWEHRTHGPRPEQVPADFCSIEIKDFVFRISTSTMENIVNQYKVEKNV